MQRRTFLSGLASLPALAASPNTASAARQSQNLQALIDQAVSTGGKLTLPAGIFSAKGLTITAPVAISGVPGQTILQAPAGTAHLSITRAANVMLSGLVFENIAHTPAPDVKAEDEFQLQALECTDLTIENCIFRNSQGSGLLLDACNGRVVGNQAYDLGQLAIKSGSFTGNYPSGMGRGVEITGNHVHHIGNGGIYIMHNGQKAEDDGSLITNNRVEHISSGSGNGPNGNGIDVFNAAHVIVANNRVSNCAYGGIRVVSAKHTQVTGNNISAIADAGIFVEYAFESAVIADNIVEDVTSGILISGGEGVLGYVAVCASNIVRNVARPPTNPQSSNFLGIAIASIATTCHGNVVENVANNSHGPGIGILVGDWSASHVHQIDGNMIKGAACGIGITASKEAGSTKFSVINNTIADASVAAITLLNQTTYGEGSPDRLTPVGNDLARDTTASDLIVLSGNVSLP